ncbi:MAG TPA: rRNA small subunit methyltransferase 1, partial [Deltaproteobacteria bacterium]|nr:rRNA small subunit methyltransferase 1 [Deltaproteobacteria bacterium]
SLIARLQRGEHVALISDAGTPLVSDPGYRLVSAAIEASIAVVAVPGPCAAVAALSVSGLPPDRFLVLGFLPRDRGRRVSLLEGYRRERATTVLYVAPHRVIDVLGDLQACWGERRVALGRELTKPGESWLRGSVGEIREQLSVEAGADRVRGEITLVIEGARDVPDGDEAQVEALIFALIGAGVWVGVVRDVVARIYDRPRRWVYQRALSALDPGEQTR